MIQTQYVSAAARDWTARSERSTHHDAIRSRPSLGMLGVLSVEIIIGYEWFVSGLVKLVKGDFPAGLAEELIKKAPTAATWYGGFIKSVAIPNAVAFGYLVEISELLAGVVLIVGPLLWMFGWDRISDRTRAVVLVSIAAAAIGGAFLALNLHMANGAGHPWLLPGSSFDEGIDLDSILPAILIVVAAASVIWLRRLRLERPVPAPSPSERTPDPGY